MVEELKLPDQQTFTREELSQRWKCNPSKIDAYIRTGQLRAALTPAVRDGLQEWMFYKCEATDKQLLDAIRHDEPLSKFTEIQGEFIPCPKYLCVSVESNSNMPADSRKIHDTLVYVHGLDPDTNPAPFSGEYVQVRYFLDSYGNALIPIEEDWINFPLVKKEHLDSLTIIPLEEIKRFECENNIKQIEQVRKDSETTSSKTKDRDFYGKPPPADDIFLDIKEVSARVSFKPPTIRKWAKEGKFPRGTKMGTLRRWHKSVIDSWMQKEWKKEDDDKFPDE